MRHRALHVEVDAVEDGALVDDQHGQLFEYLGQLFDRLSDSNYFLVALIDQLPRQIEEEINQIRKKANAVRGNYAQSS